MNEAIPLEKQSPIYGISLYDYHRKPRAPIVDNSQTTIQIRNLNVEITCPICLGILHDTMTVMECLHRFCSECIEKCLRTGLTNLRRKECPACRVKCTSRRHLRRDTNFDGIIAAVYPHLDDYEAKQEEEIDRITKDIMGAGAKNLIVSVEEGKKRQAMHARKKRKPEEVPVVSPLPRPKVVKREIKAVPDPVPNFGAIVPMVPMPMYNIPEVKMRPLKEDEVGCVLLKHPKEVQLEQIMNRFVRASRTITMRHLAKLLSKKLTRTPTHTDIIISFNVTGDELREDISLGTVSSQWKGWGDMPLYYRLRAT
ncbi:e3 ubiquitin-protein ligase RING2-like [Planoprotostelium fungivorum]|uniref:RING-type E3 ubiquitin transferase n=1 Tax=Planoprotostelium fungivorum TaxID=1890364 RepID=A0A2P6MR59_9EUKA|nr:e3 ubiquitin-protein ligase RING2-like [Planoprotostelium fungivorum]